MTTKLLHAAVPAASSQRPDAITMTDKELPTWSEPSLGPLTACIHLTERSHSDLVSRLGPEITPKIDSQMNGLPAELVNMIVDHIRDYPQTLYSLCRVSKAWFAASAPMLRLYGKLSHLFTHVRSPSRRVYYAACLETVRFWNHEEFWTGEPSECPSFSRLKNFELLDTVFHRISLDDLIPFLNPSLRRLVIWGEGDNLAARVPVFSDNAWISHVRQSCFGLESLCLDIELQVSSDLLRASLEKMANLKELRFGEAVNTVLNDEIVRAILYLPHLNSLALSYRMILATVHDIDTDRKLKNLQKLEVFCTDAAEPAYDILLSGINSLESLNLTLERDWEQFEPGFRSRIFAIISTLSSLRHLVIRLDHGLQILEDDFCSLTQLQLLEALDISFISYDDDQEELCLQVSGLRFEQTLASLKCLTHLTLDIDACVMVCSYVTAVLIGHYISKLTWFYFPDLELVVDDQSLFGNLTIYDMVNILPHTVWSSSNHMSIQNPLTWLRDEFTELVQEETDKDPEKDGDS